jgi:hypothetical protein
LYFYKNIDNDLKLINNANPNCPTLRRFKILGLNSCLVLYPHCRFEVNNLGWVRDRLSYITYDFSQLVLNYKRLRFYPVIRDPRGYTLFNCSLGIIAKFLNKGKAFTKKKAVYLLLFSLIRKILLFSKLESMSLVLNRLPKYLQEFMSTLYTPAVTIYSNPFKTSQLMSETKEDTHFDFKYVQVITSKSYGYIKMGKKGRLKRKISKRVQLSNRVLD